LSCARAAPAQLTARRANVTPTALPRSRKAPNGSLRESTRCTAQ
jgi:hypothetical protein